MLDDSFGDVNGWPDVRESQGQRVSERDQLRGPLGRLDPGEPGGAEDVPLRRVAPLQSLRRRRVHPHRGTGQGKALALRLRADVDHPNAAFLRHVAELAALAHGTVPSTQRDPAASTSRFQIGASALIRSIASRAPAKACSR